MNMKSIKRVLAVAVASTLAVTMLSTTALACNSKDGKKMQTQVKDNLTSNGSLYSHVDVRIDSTFTHKDVSNGTVSSETVLKGTVSNLTVTLDGNNVEMQNQAVIDENNKVQYEYQSVAGHKSGSLNFGEDSTIGVKGDFTYSVDGKSNTIQFDVSFKALKSTNVCEGYGNYGYDAVITSEDITEIVEDAEQEDKKTDETPAEDKKDEKTEPVVDETDKKDTNDEKAPEVTPAEQQKDTTVEENVVPEGATPIVVDGAEEEEDNTIVVEKNDNDNQPSTGDESNIWIFIVIGCVAVAGMVAFVIISKKNK